MSVAAAVVGGPRFNHMVGLGFVTCGYSVLPRLCTDSLSPSSRWKASMAATSRGTKANILVTFDVDGTLLGNSSSKRKLATAAGKPPPPNRVGNSAHKEAIDRAVHDVYGISGRVDDLPHAGLTDQIIVRNLCASQGVPESVIWENMSKVITSACGRIDALIAKDNLADDVLPGVPELLEELRSRGVYLGLVTGNFADIGWAKMSSAGLRHFFNESCSAFGSDCRLRPDILAKAGERAEVAGFSREHDSSGKCTNVYHVGDAVADMESATCVGGRGVGVLTGSFGREQLDKLDPYIVLEDLSDTQSALRLFGLDS